MGKVCYVPLKGIDDVIARKLGFSFIVKKNKEDAGVQVADVHRVAHLRALYDESSKDKLNLDNLDDTIKKLGEFYNKLARSNAAKISVATSNLESANNKLRKTYGYRKRTDRISMIASYFMDVLDELEGRFPTVSREAIANGFYDKKGNLVGGQIAIFNAVYRKLMRNMAQYQRHMQNPRANEEDRKKYEYKAQEVATMLEPDIFSALAARARFILKNTEGIVLGMKLEYAATADVENYSENLDQVYDASESKREHWQDSSDNRSAWGSIGRSVRRLLSTIPMIDPEKVLDKKDDWTKAVVRDDLGNVRYLDPVSAHQELQAFLWNSTNEEDMMDKLTGYNSRSWFAPLVIELKNNPMLRTQFFCDFKKNFQPYAMFYEDTKESKSRGYKFYKRKVLNSVKDILNGTYLLRITRFKALSEETSIYNSGSLTKLATVNWENIGKLRNLVFEWTDTGSYPNSGIFKGKLLRRDKEAPTKAEKVDFLYQVFEAMGIEIGIPGIEAIVTSSSIYRVYDALRAYFDIDKLEYKKHANKKDENIKAPTAKGIGLILEGDNATAWNREQYSKIGKMTMVSLYKGNREGSAVIERHTKKILNEVAIASKSSKVERRARFHDKDYFSDVAPSFLGDVISDIKAYVEAPVDQKTKKENLRKYLEATFCNNSYFVDRDANGNITHCYCYWLEELLKCCDTSDSIRLEDTFAGQIYYDRELGSKDQDFEQFSSKTHAISMIHTFLSDHIQGKSLVRKGLGGGIERSFSALYPVFTLGDSGVSKTIRAPRINSEEFKWNESSKEEIVSRLFDVYKQERKRMNIMSKMNGKLKKDGYKEVHSRDEFSLLVFFNEDKYRVSVNATDDEVKAKIKKYMEDSFNQFKKNLEDIQVLEKAEDGSYIHFTQFGKSADIVDQSLEDFFYNTKLATINQLQLMTVDPCFYKDVKDMQKRYKEIHAPGSKLSLRARNPFKPGHPLYDEGGLGIERALYIDDIEVDVTKGGDEDSDFAKALKANKKTASAIELYRKTSLTDGQGWRSLSSYRKVLGMAGRWTAGMEEVYDEIMALRSEYGKRVPSKNDADFADYTDRIRSIAEKAVVFQPLKPYMFTHEIYTINNGTETQYVDKMLIPVQHKYAEAVLIPELLPEGSKLRDMAYWMEEHKEKDEVTGQIKEAPIDLICATSAVKVGSFGSTDVSNLSQYDQEILEERQKIGDANTTISNQERLTRALNKGYVHQLNYKDYRIQTNVPEHMNSSQLFGTQIRKLIMSHLNYSGTYSYLKDLRESPETVNLGGKWGKVKAQELTGRNLLALYNSLIVANIFDDLSAFENDLSDIKKASDMLMQSVLANERETQDNLLAYAITGDEKFVIALFEGALEHDSAALLLSVFKKRVNKQAIKGGSAVQVSAFGISAKEESEDLKFVIDPNNPNNILYAECEIPFALSYYDVRTRTEVNLDFDDYCELDGTLKVGRYLEKDDPEYNRYLSYTDENGKVYKPKIEEDYPDILSFVAYRIPTERAYSMLNLRVKRFSRRIAGGTIKVPTAGTTIAGFDFDIDKLYFMMREFRKHSPSSTYSEDKFSNEQKNLIFAEIYNQYPNIAIALENERARSNRLNAPLNSFWKEANIEERFGVDKNEVFEEAAKKLGILPKSSDNTEEVISSYFEKYDFEKTPEQNSRAARNNLIIDLIQARLSDYETFADRYTPGGFNNAKIAARKIRELIYSDEILLAENPIKAMDKAVKDKLPDPEPNYDPTDPMTMIIFNQQNQVAAKLIGIFANHNTNHAISSLLKMIKIKAGNAIEFAGHSFSKDGVGMDLIHPPHRTDGYNDVDLYMAELLAASVDAVKEPVLNYMNFNTYTADVGALLVRIGYSFEEVGLLLNQPAIVWLCEECANKNIHISTAIKSLKNIISDHESKNFNADLSKEGLAKNIVGKRKIEKSGKTYDIRQHPEQLAILELFEKAHNVASDVSLFVNGTKFTAANAAKSTMGGLYSQEETLNSFHNRLEQGTLTIEIETLNESDLGTIKAPISNDPSLLDLGRSEYADAVRMHPLAYEQAMYDAFRKVLRKFCPEGDKKKGYYPYGRSMYASARSDIRALSEYNLDEDTMNSTHRDLLVYLLANQTNSAFCGEALHKASELTKASGLTNREFYQGEAFINYMYEVLDAHPELKDLALFEYMLVEEGKDSKGETVFNLKVQDVGGLSPTAKEVIKESWAEMVETNEDGEFKNPAAAQLAKDLFLFNFYKLGFDFAPLSFMNLAPVAVKEVMIVPRDQSIPVNTFKETKTEGNDVYVFYPGSKSHSQIAWDEYGFENGVGEGLRGNAYSLPIYDEDGAFNADAFHRFCLYAKSNPDKVFKVQTLIEQHDIDAMIKAGVDMPSNIQFTEESVLGKEWSEVQYGVYRSYQEFLNEILDGTNSSAEISEFRKQYVLNHLDNYRFVLDTKARHLREFIKNKVVIFKDGKPIDNIEIDVSGASEDIQPAFCKVHYNKEGEITAVVWKPIVKVYSGFHEYYYMANGIDFNINKEEKMNYILVEPYGSKGTSLMYKSGLLIETASSDIKESIPQTPVGNDPKDPNPPFDRAKAEAIIFQNMVAYLQSLEGDRGQSSIEEDSAQARKYMRESRVFEMTDSELYAYVEMLKKEARENGQIWLDENGNKCEAC